MTFGHATYLTILILWSLPILVLQWTVAAKSLWRARRLLVATVLVCGTFLSLADGFAINSGIWRIHPEGTVGIQLTGDLPLEEALFYYLTALMSAQGFVMLAFYFKPKKTSF